MLDRKRAFWAAAWVIAALLMVVGAQQVCGQCRDGKLPVDGGVDDFFGVSVAISGEAAVVGALGDDDNGDRSGSAYVFHYDFEEWVEEEKLTSSDGAVGDEFGWSVAISGDVAVVGAYRDDDNGQDSGSAYVYRFDGATWVEEEKLTASDGAAGHEFGWSVAISGDVAVVGVGRDDDNGQDSGSAYVFRYDGGAWVQEAKLTASDGGAGDRFGRSVAISGATAIVGAIGDGSAYLFDTTTGQQLAKLVPNDGGSGFGGSVSISGDVAVVGAYADDDNGSDSGSAYLFRYDGAKWVEEEKLTASDGAAGDRFGWSVSISGDLAVVGARLDDDNGEDSGSAYAFRDNGATWVEEEKITSSDGAAGDWFGWSVSISGDVAVVGAVYDDDKRERSGSAHVFDLNCPVNTPPVGFEVTRGVHVKGGLFSLMESDDRYLLVAARRPPLVSQPSVEVVLEGRAPLGAVRRLSFLLEASTTTALPIQWTDLYNFDSELWERLDSRPATPNDTIVVVDVTKNAGRFVDDATGTIRARVSFYDPGIPIAGWFGRFDQMGWSVILE